MSEAFRPRSASGGREADRGGGGVAVDGGGAGLGGAAGGSVDPRGPGAGWMGTWPVGSSL
ncbi:MAG: hypothetical protein ACJ77X_01975 [Chloroflexota bacterium]